MRSLGILPGAVTVTLIPYGGGHHCNRNSATTILQPQFLKLIVPEVLVDCQGESNIHQIVVTVACRLCPLFPEGEFAVFRYKKTPCFYGKSYYFYRISCRNPLFSPTGNLAAKGDAKWWTSIRRMFDSLRL